MLSHISYEIGMILIKSCNCIKKLHRASENTLIRLMIVFRKPCSICVLGFIPVIKSLM